MSWRHRLVHLLASADHRLRTLRRRTVPVEQRARALGGRLVLTSTAVPGVVRRGARRQAVLLVGSTDHEPGSGTEDDAVVLVADGVEALTPGWQRCLAAALRGPTVAATPMVVHPDRPLTGATPHDLLVRELGLTVAVDRAGEPVLRARGAGARATSPELTPTGVISASSCLVVARTAYDAAGGLDPALDPRTAIADLGLRLTAAGGRIAAVPGVAVVDTAPVATPAGLRQPFPVRTAAWHQLVDRHGARLRRGALGPGAPARLALTTAAPGGLVVRRWGDWELAGGLARGLVRAGLAARVQSLDQADDRVSRASDVQLVVRGLARVRRTPGQAHVIWVISHPELVTADELDEADLVLAASVRLATHLRTLSSTPVEVLLQGTDHHRFRPVPPDPAHAHPVTVVANTRGEFRPSVAMALEAGLRPAVHGDGWAGLIDPSLVVSRHVPNAALPPIYGSASVVLNDHWPEMRSWGIVSNRVYDVLACGTPVVSDHVDEIADQLGDAVPTYSSSAELRRVVDDVLGDPAAARRRARAGRDLVLAHHTLDHRATELVALLGRHGLLPRA